LKHWLLFLYLKNAGGGENRRLYTSLIRNYQLGITRITLIF
jgi:hypothetical protein